MLPERWSKWSKEDDKRLIEVANRYSFNGVVNWNNVMAHFPHKPKTTIQARYSYTLNPLISHGNYHKSKLFNTCHLSYIRFSVLLNAN